MKYVNNKLVIDGVKIQDLAEKKKKKLNELSLEELKKIEPKLTNDVLKVFDLKNSVNSKKE